MARQTKKKQQQQNNQPKSQHHQNPPGGVGVNIIQIDPIEAARRAAAARAYALNSHTADDHGRSSNKAVKRGNSSSSASARKKTGNSTTLSSTRRTLLNNNAGLVSGLPTATNKPSTLMSMTTTTTTTATTNTTNAVRKLMPTPLINSNDIHQHNYTNTNADANLQYSSPYHQHDVQLQQWKQNQIHLQQKMRLNQISNNIDDEEYIKFVQGLWDNFDSSGNFSSVTGNTTFGHQLSVVNDHDNSSAGGAGGVGGGVGCGESEVSGSDILNPNEYGTANQGELNDVRKQQSDDRINEDRGEDDDDEEYDYQLEEDDDDEDDDDQNDENNVLSQEGKSSENVSYAATTVTSTTSDIIDPIDELDNFEFDHVALEQELGSLLEEDMEAAVNSLLLSHETATAESNMESMSSSGSNVMSLPPLSSLQSTPQKKKKRNDFHDSPVFISTPLSHNTKTPPSSVATASTTNIVVGTPTTPSKGSIPTSPPKGTTANLSTSAHPLPTEEQILKLQKLMTDHYQVLLQQAVLAVRAAHGNKYNKDGVNSAQYLHHQVKNGSGGVGRGGSMGDQSALQSGIYKPFSGTRKRHHDFFFCGETADDLGMIVDGAVTMLQDLDQNRKDAIRYSIQMSRARKRRRRLDHNNNDNSNQDGRLYTTATSGSMGGTGIVTDSISHNDTDDIEEEQRGWLTRSAFSRTLQENKWGGEELPDFEEASQKSNISTGGYSNSALGLGANTTFGVKGLARLDQTFAAIDNSLNAAVGGTGVGGINIFDEADHGRACELLLRHARADYSRELVPGYRDLSHILTYPGEVVGSPAQAVDKAQELEAMSSEQQTSLRKNRGQFTASEDNLLLRGVNLYGEKEWTLISDRYLPDRTISSISQRYWRLCLLIYKGQGIAINEKGELKTPPKHLKGVEDFNEELIAQSLKPVPKPMQYGLYRWSMEEDIMLLKAVPLMGRMFAEIAKRLIPHRDRGALRKRYQVLERRVKGALKRDKKSTNDIVRKKVAPLMEAISKKGPLPVLPKGPTSGKEIVMSPIISQHDRHGTDTIKKTKAVAVHKHPFGKYAALQPSKAPQAPKSLNQLSSRFGTSTPQEKSLYPDPPTHGPKANNSLSSIFASESPTKADGSRIGFEKIMNGDYSQMSAMKHFIDDNNGSTSTSTQNAFKQANDLLPNFNFDNSCSGLSMLSSADLKAYTKDENKDNNTRRGTSILSSVLGRSNINHQTPSPPKPIVLSQNSDISTVDVHDHGQSLDGLSFSNLNSLPMPEVSPTAHRRDESSFQQGQLSYTGTPNAFSQFPNAQASNMFHNMTNNSLMVPQHEVDAAATLSQMSNSSANFPTDLLSSPNSPPDYKQTFPDIPSDTPPKTTAARPSLFQKVVKDRTNK